MSLLSLQCQFNASLLNFTNPKPFNGSVCLVKNHFVQIWRNTVGLEGGRQILIYLMMSTRFPWLRKQHYRSSTTDAGKENYKRDLFNISTVSTSHFSLLNVKILSHTPAKRLKINHLYVNVPKKFIQNIALSIWASRHTKKNSTYTWCCRTLRSFVLDA